MDEVSFRSTYQQVNPQRCVFEKAINNRRCDCSMHRKILLASREAVACDNPTALLQCSDYLSKMREQARFSLRETVVTGVLPHNKELKVQAGSMLALQSLLIERALDDYNAGRNDCTEKPDIHSVLQHAMKRYASIENLPFSRLVQGVVSYRSRRKKM